MRSLASPQMVHLHIVDRLARVVVESGRSVINWAITIFIRWFARCSIRRGAHCRPRCTKVQHMGLWTLWRWRSIRLESARRCFLRTCKEASNNNLSHNLERNNERNLYRRHGFTIARHFLSFAPPNFQQGRNFSPPPDSYLMIQDMGEQISDFCGHKEAVISSSGTG